MTINIPCRGCGEPWDTHHVHEHFNEFTTHVLSDPESPIIESCPCCISEEVRSFRHLMNNRELRPMQVETIADYINDQLELFA